MHGIIQPQLKLVKTLHQGMLVLNLIGDLDSRSSLMAKEGIKATIEEGNGNLLINMESVKYVDSAGLGALVSALKTARERAGNIYLVGLTAQVRMVVELTRLNRIFTIFDTVDMAVTRLTDPSFTDL